MFPFVSTNHHIRPSSTNNLGISNAERNFWSVWTGSECSAENKSKKNYQKLNNKSQRTVDSVNKTNAAVGCYASEFIPKDTKTKSIGALDSYSASDKVRKFYLSMEGGYLQSNDKAEHSWIKNIKHSMDPHSNNVILELCNNELCVRTIRNINVNEEITLWFSEEVLAAMYIPFLTPANIRGKNTYTCNICEKTFENPNPLKIHISTSCERLSEHSLWSRLEAFRHRSTKPTYESTTLMNFHQTAHQRLSAFQPVRTNLQYNSIDALATRSSGNNTMFEGLPSVLNAVESEQAITAAAHLETIVSNMGTSKQGHLCIYCGKLYSRKYGLKIHIRTHTGFKPLKCKYCYRPFGDPSNLNKHVRLHVQGNTVYKCTDCDKVLVRRRDLQRHIQARHGKCSDGEKSDGGSAFRANVYGGETTVSTCTSSSDSDDEESMNEMIEVE